MADFFKFCPPGVRNLLSFDVSIFKYRQTVIITIIKRRYLYNLHSLILIIAFFLEL